MCLAFLLHSDMLSRCVRLRGAAGCPLCPLCTSSALRTADKSSKIQTIIPHFNMIIVQSLYDCVQKLSIKRFGVRKSTKGLQMGAKPTFLRQFFEFGAGGRPNGARRHSGMPPCAGGKSQIKSHDLIWRGRPGARIWRRRAAIYRCPAAEWSKPGLTTSVF